MTVVNSFLKKVSITKFDGVARRRLVRTVVVFQLNYHSKLENSQAGLPL